MGWNPEEERALLLVRIWHRQRVRQTAPAVGLIQNVADVVVVGEEEMEGWMLAQRPQKLDTLGLVAPRAGQVMVGVKRAWKYVKC
jgi:hypothetical protein